MRYREKVSLVLLLLLKNRVCAYHAIVRGKSKAQAVEEDDEEEELRKLQAEMAM